MTYYIVPLSSPIGEGVNVSSDSLDNAICKYLSYYPLSDLVIYDPGLFKKPSFGFYYSLRFISFKTKSKLKKLLNIT